MGIRTFVSFKPGIAWPETRTTTLGAPLTIIALIGLRTLRSFNKKRKQEKKANKQQTGTERLIWAQGSTATLKAVSTTIRGVRINLAAAICWENYMPLLRQALYAQNINLYLTPTADNRDAWLGLMRTVALEGRCFVVSSNMCIPGDDQIQVGHDNGHPIVEGYGESYAVSGEGRERVRRNSCMTEEGFEIALPGTGAGAVKPKKVRRKSIFDEDGNEIIISCTCTGSHYSAAAIDEESEVDNAAAAAKTSHGRAVTAKVNGASSNKQSANFVSRGGSCIVSPFGDVVAGPQWEDAQGLIYADVDFDNCIRGRLDLDAAGSYSRNDSFKFSVEGLDLDPLPYY
ncbi:carbon-nitrogen hydrolase [Pseudomassariella vexata]|uniref:Carbon-nitrogen hydrolase n=1 Tax=Pseudomassariella vexata TaxID=1141098 RepID=A0A1Y2D9Z5_9PEZI|nr:carbon-nitrogen hydrolase [Pseudomassariella vexata]ORY56088.1 carbon-nitrogen hydrolase [Pseudomassariella vexata]